MKLRMGTRGSALALAQAGQLVERLIALEKGLDVETVIIKTSGDSFSAANPYEKAAPDAPGGGKGLFIKEIEEALLAGTIDFAVHSGKDLPAEVADGTVIAAWPAREEPRDAFVGKGGGRLADLPKGARVASSSLRRVVQLKAARPDLQVVPMRGNVDTRIRKMEAGECEGLLLAEAGLRRLGRAELKREVLAVDIMVPSPVQGALAVQTRAALSAAAKIVAKLDDPGTRKAVEFEREVMRALGGGCSMPLGVFARADGSGMLVDAFYSEADGSRFKRLSRACSCTAEEARALARELRA
jgi:hydroxymethylbilane synthase